MMRDLDLPSFRDNLDVREIMRPIFAHGERMKETLAAGWKSSGGL